MAGADLVIHDAQYTPEEYAKGKKNWGHSTFDYVVELAAAAGVRRLALTHHDPTHDDAFVAEIEKRAKQVARDIGSSMEVFCAFEGCELILQPPDEPSAEFVGPNMTRTTLTKARVLIIDDDPDMRALAKRALERDGHGVVEAGSGEEALRLVEGELPDLIILDLVMPTMSGKDLLRELRSRQRTAPIPVLVVTSMGDEETTREGFDLGATDYLTKPYSIPQLAARVRSCLARVAVQS
jgi:CheY-like chemotaxis protein